VLIVIAALAGLLLTLACRRLAFAIGMLNQPNPIVASHVKPVPYLGGLAVALASLVGIGLVWMFPALYPSQVIFPSPLVWVGGALFLILGLVDDARALTPFVKLALQFALTFALLFGLLPWTRSGLAALPSALLFALWIVTVVNAVNMTDVCDGLITGLSSIALLAIALTRPDHAVSAVAILGACIGFLVFNFPPARIYQGDAGAHFLGYLLAVMTWPGEATLTGQITPAALVFGPLLLGVFLFEISFITRMRVRKGLKWWRGSPDHFALRMQSIGISKRTTVVCAWAAAVPWALAAIAWDKQPFEISTAVLLALVAVGSIAAWIWLRGLEPARAGQQRTTH
jgi:UDP-GlcNAc:undecaprenyl-phosphate GlcNAc-1-phosphate transferase